MIKFLKSLFSGAPVGEADSPAATIEHKDFRITPCPKSTQGGWTTEAKIEKQIGDEIKTHYLIRADINPTKDGAIELAIIKAKTMIDQQGERILK